jgi:hypothetical protein
VPCVIAGRAFEHVAFNDTLHEAAALASDARIIIDRHPA